MECKLAQFRTGGDERCLACHGDVRQMEVIVQVDENFGTMGWCMECHLQVKGAKERKRSGNTMAGWYHAKELDMQNVKLTLDWLMKKDITTQICWTATHAIIKN